MAVVLVYLGVVFCFLFFFFFKQKTAYEMRISDWSSDVCSSDLASSSSARRAFLDCLLPMRRRAVGRVPLVHVLQAAPVAALVGHTVVDAVGGAYTPVALRHYTDAGVALLTLQALGALETLVTLLAFGGQHVPIGGVRRFVIGVCLDADPRGSVVRHRFVHRVCCDA